ncbi:MAG TPA: ATP-binding protein [Herpetosiphonaceae bacterium]
MTLSSAGLRARHRRVMRVLRGFFGVQILFSVGLALALDVLTGLPPHWPAVGSGALVGLLLLPAARRALGWLYIPLLLGLDLIHVTLLLWETPLESLARGSLWALAYIPVLVAAGRWWSYGGGGAVLLIVLAADAAVLFGRLPPREAAPILVFQAVTAALGTWASAQGEARARRDLLHLEELALEQERVALAIHSHQHVAAQIADVGALLTAADAALPADPLGAGRELNAAADALRTTQATLQRSLRGVRPTPLAQATLPEVLARELSLLRTEAGLDSSFRCDAHLPPLRPAAAEYLLRAAQEALENVRAHAGATKVTIELRATPGEIALTIADNGQGFDAADILQRPAGQWGLPALRERAAQLGGSLEIDGSAAEGTTVRVRLPVGGW